MAFTKITLQELIEAYRKLKANIYHDTTELFQRRQIAEFEFGSINETNFKNVDNGRLTFGSLGIKLENKLERLKDFLNSYNKHTDLKGYLEKVDIKVLPKKFNHGAKEETFLSNRRIKDKYQLEKVTVFADFPVELHLVCVLWIMRHGFKLDKSLGDHCKGNRLILNKNKSAVVSGSALFRPYFKQYQAWRDGAVKEAGRKLEMGQSIAFINLDLKDYFYSARIDFEEG